MGVKGRGAVYGGECGSGSQAGKDAVKGFEPAFAVAFDGQNRGLGNAGQFRQCTLADATAAAERGDALAERHSCR